ncbi:putative gibberellin 3-beta hydroxylase [Colletotrichum zoysiae]|uniref:Gibberellin 3-beta hydroxylase n=1 Tax=Colletotrichum zoysiae TaxID=1216348 RepID=A0AAD9HK35_9PEZI|nr:putative gibberellin 3-beta hydroxylase [Colletotrichum zoysiae]
MAPHAEVDVDHVVSGLKVQDEVANLVTVSIGKIMQCDKTAEESLLEASKDLGFFYLDVRDHTSREVTKQIEIATASALQFYGLPQSEKSTWEVNKDHVAGEEIIGGYKPAGVQTGSVAGKGDGFEGFLIFEHALRNAARDKPVNLPKAFQEQREVIEATNQSLGDIGRVLLDSLSRSLNLTDEQNLARHHRKGHASPTALGLLKYLPYGPESEEVGHVPHTDIGSLSMVFSDVGGLQVYHPGKKAWVFIPPKPGHTVCNIGDSAEFLSKNVLRSSLHRVIPHPAATGKSKLTVVYLMRPETDTVFVDREGKEWRSVDWHNMKNRLFAEDLESQASNLALTGRLGHDDLWDEDTN